MGQEDEEEHVEDERRRVREESGVEVFMRRFLGRFRGRFSCGGFRGRVLLRIRRRFPWYSV